MNNSIIGKTYLANDNSYTICLSDAGYTSKKQSEPYFAGSNSRTKIPALIVSEPYNNSLQHKRGSVGDNNYYFEDYTFVNLQHPDTGHIFRVLYNKKGIVENSNSHNIAILDEQTIVEINRFVVLLKLKGIIS